MLLSRAAVPSPIEKVYIPIDQNVILKFSLIISLVYNKDTDIEAPLPVSVFQHYEDDILSSPNIDKILSS